jgi:hypothetical protein
MTDTAAGTEAWASLMQRLGTVEAIPYPHSNAKAAIADAVAWLADPKNRETLTAHALVQLETSCESGNQAVIDTDPAILLALLAAYDKRPWWRRV